MNLKGRYDMLRTAILAMVGVSDDVGSLKQMAAILQPQALVDTDAAAALLVLQTLVVTHDSSNKPDGVRFEVTVRDGNWSGTLAEWQARGN